jgi:hypothetical protein
MGRSINYSASPLLASRTPVWRSKFIVAALAVAFAGLAGRAAYVQVFGNDFFQRQGEVRFARTLELPANRGRVLDRNGLILASSVVAQSIWAIPEDVDRADPKLRQLAKLLEMPLADLRKRLADDDKTFVWIKRQVDDPVAKEIAALGIKGIYQRREYKRQYPEGEAAAHVVGFTNVEDIGQEGVELAFNRQLAGKSGSRRVIKDRLGRVVEDVRDVVPPVDGPDLQLSIDSKVQYFAYQKLKDAVLAHKAHAGSVVVLDTISARCWRWPTTRATTPQPAPEPHGRATAQPRAHRQLRAWLDHEALHRRAGAGERPGHAQHPHPYRAGSHHHWRLDDQRLAPERRVDRVAGDPEVEQRGHGQDGHADEPARNVGETYAQAGFGQKPQHAVPRRGHRPSAALQDLAAHRARDDELWLRPLGFSSSSSRRPTPSSRATAS